MLTFSKIIILLFSLFIKVQLHEDRWHESRRRIGSWTPTERMWTSFSEPESPWTCVWRPGMPDGLGDSDCGQWAPWWRCCNHHLDYICPSLQHNRILLLRCVTCPRSFHLSNLSVYIHFVSICIPRCVLSVPWWIKLFVLLRDFLLGIQVPDTVLGYKS